MEDLSISNERLNSALDNHKRDLENQIKNLDDKQHSLTERLNNLNKKKAESFEANGDADATGDDLVEANAGGKVVAAKRSTLTQLKGTRLETLFSGRWDKKLQRDRDGRILLDVNPLCFQQIVDYLNEMAISSEDDPPDLPSVVYEHMHTLRQLLQLFGFLDKIPTVKLPHSNINIMNSEPVAQLLHYWLGEDGSDGDFSLLYSSSRDGRSDATFHSKCDNNGCTLTVIETTDGYVFGGYSSTPWAHGNDTDYSAAKEAFLFVLAGNGISAPHKMKLNNANDNCAVCHCSWGPTFGLGHDLSVNGSSVTLAFGYTYESGPSDQLTYGNDYTIKDMEVFSVKPGVPSRPTISPTNRAKQTNHKIPEEELVKRFSEDINDAINKKRESLLRFEAEILNLEDSFEDEHNFIETFASGDVKDVVTLNVSGTMMVTKRCTLRTAEDSVLALQFDDSKWTEQGCNTPRVKEWTPDDVSAWVQKIHGMSDDVVGIFKENDITGYELLALKKDGLIMLGITRPGTVCVLLDEIKKLEKACHGFVTLIEHSPYCFGKILDYLRLKRLHSQGLADEPKQPVVCDSQKKRFEKVVKFYFPGDSANAILG